MTLQETLTEQEIAFLKRIATGNSLLTNGKASPRIQSLIDRGYCRTSPARSGPLGIYTGDIFILLTEAGRILVKPNAQAE